MQTIILSSCQDNTQFFYNVIHLICILLSHKYFFCIFIFIYSFVIFSPFCIYIFTSALYTSLFKDCRLAKQDGVLPAHALLVWGKCSRRLSELHTGFYYQFQFFSLFFTWKHLRIHRSSFQ